ncbi:hypothetical protein Zmor_001440 [Zophobas morio]|uniref:Uncharacterized protein n=1 Tax=Zophobas morio TaxID=2755281 RepID=A0AA38MSU2_9CUCU|nr:hypothetical protein Zmor_001440 [Zophobas morio]
MLDIQACPRHCASEFVLAFVVANTFGTTYQLHTSKNNIKGTALILRACDFVVFDLLKWLNSMRPLLVDFKLKYANLRSANKGVIDFNSLIRILVVPYVSFHLRLIFPVLFLTK